MAAKLKTSPYNYHNENDICLPKKKLKNTPKPLNVLRAIYQKYNMPLFKALSKGARYCQVVEITPLFLSTQINASCKQKSCDKPFVVTKQSSCAKVHITRVSDNNVYTTSLIKIIIKKSS